MTSPQPMALPFGGMTCSTGLLFSFYPFEAYTTYTEFSLPRAALRRWLPTEKKSWKTSTWECIWAPKSDFWEPMGLEKARWWRFWLEWIRLLKATIFRILASKSATWNRWLVAHTQKNYEYPAWFFLGDCGTDRTKIGSLVESDISISD